MKEFVLDGTRITSLEAFYDEISRALIPGVRWGRNLDAFNDILRGGFGTPVEGFLLRWVNSAISREKLGYSETVKQLKRQLSQCHPSARDRLQEELRMALSSKGPTVFEWLVEIIEDHGSKGEQSSDNVRLILH